MPIYLFPKEKQLNISSDYYIHLQVQYLWKMYITLIENHM